MEIIGHRGAPAHYPENTLGSFRLAMTTGCRWVELDIHLHSGRLIVFHDEVVDRTTNGMGLLHDFSLDALRLLDAGQGEVIPFVEEVFDLMIGLGINVELKGLGSGRAFGELLAQMDLAQGPQLVVSSFEVSELEAFKSFCTNYPLALLVYEFNEQVAQVAKDLAVEAIHLSIRGIDEQVVKGVHATGLLCRVFTVRTLDELALCQQVGVDAVFADDPASCFKWLREQEANR